MQRLHAAVRCMLSKALAPRRAPLDRFIERITLRGDDRGLSEIVLLETEGDRTTTVFEHAQIERRFGPGELERLFVEGRPLSGETSAP